ncbi:hypothetical protein BJ170DRAFT_683163 [Xylariales sp. AK1849]|nr:hypothetical protein BJ170DRAFT_683163 [Xylariales sp. AK1849]
MAPLTRGRSKAAQESTQETADHASPVLSDAAVPDETTFEETVTLSGKRKPSPNDDEAETSNESDQASPKRQRLAVRVRQETGLPAGQRRLNIEAKLLDKKSKRSRSASIADSEESEGSNGEPTPHSASKQLQEEATQQLSQDLLVGEHPLKPAAVGVASKGKHVVFGDDDDVETFVATAAVKPPKPTPATVEEDEDESDEAPEAVSTSAAAKESLKAAHALSQAADKQAETLRKKRQERDNLFRQQAQKRKRIEKSGVPRSKAGKERAVGLVGDGDITDGTDEVERATGWGRRRAEKYKLPDVLPPEFLTDSESEHEDERALGLVKKPRKINFESAVQTLAKAGKAPRDQIVGSTAYRVMANQGDPKLAPRNDNNSKVMKEMYMHRRRVGVTPAKTKGFFKRK